MNGNVCFGLNFAVKANSNDRGRICGGKGKNVSAYGTYRSNGFSVFISVPGKSGREIYGNAVIGNESFINENDRFSIVFNVIFSVGGSIIVYKNFVAVKLCPTSNKFDVAFRHFKRTVVNGCFTF